MAWTDYFAWALIQLLVVAVIALLWQAIVAAAMARRFYLQAWQEAADGRVAATVDAVVYDALSVGYDLPNARMWVREELQRRGVTLDNSAIEQRLLTAKAHMTLPPAPQLEPAKNTRQG